MRAVVALVSIGFEQVSPAICQDDGAIIGTEWAGPNQSLAFEMSSAPTRTIGSVAQVKQIALGHNAKGADGRQYAALRAVYFVDTFTVPDRLTLMTSREVEIFREDVTRIVVPVAFACAVPTTETPLPRPTTVSLGV